MWPGRTPWRKTATTVGPSARVVITVSVVAVLLVLPFTPFLVVWFPLLILGAVLLREVWRAGYTAPDPPVRATAPTIAARPRMPAPREPIPTRTKIAWSVAGATFVAAGLVWTLSGSYGRGVVGICASIAALVGFIAWSLEA